MLDVTDMWESLESVENLEATTKEGRLSQPFPMKKRRGIQLNLTSEVHHNLYKLLFTTVLINWWRQAISRSLWSPHLRQYGVQSGCPADSVNSGWTRLSRKVKQTERYKSWIFLNFPNKKRHISNNKHLNIYNKSWSLESTGGQRIVHAAKNLPALGSSIFYLCRLTKVQHTYVSPLSTIHRCQNLRESAYMHTYNQQAVERQRARTPTQNLPS